jgi:hypothetical protein
MPRLRQAGLKTSGARRSKPPRRRRRIARIRVDRAMAEICLQRSGIDALIGQRVAASNQPTLALVHPVFDCKRPTSLGRRQISLRRPFLFPDSPGRNSEFLEH